MNLILFLINGYTHNKDCHNSPSNYYILKVNDYVRPACDYKNEVPQGSELGPTLYSLFINNTPEPEHNNLTIMFADGVNQIIKTDKARRTGYWNRTLTPRTQREVE